ncbi:MAG: hypothetical protein V5783_05975 [Pontiella sp.]
MILLIGGLFLSSIMMLHYTTSKMNPQAGGFTFENKLYGAPSLHAAADLLKKMIPESQNPAQTVANPATDSGPPSGMIQQFLKDRKAKVHWPKLKLTGFGILSDGNNGFAMINGKQYQVGQYIDDVLLLAVRTDDVLVELSGETKVLSMNIRH